MGNFLKAANDNMGRRSKVTNPDDTEIHFTYTSRNQVKKSYGANVYPREYAYDEDGRLKTLTTWRGEISSGQADPGLRAFSTWNYDADGQLTSQVDELGRTTILNYDNNGRLHTRTDARGITKGFHYDSAGRVNGITYNDGTTGIDYTYNDRGQIHSVEDAAGLRTYEYSAATGRYEGATWTDGMFNGLTQDYQFDSLGRQQQFSWSFGNNNNNGRSTNYEYDDMGRMQNVIVGNHTYTYEYLEDAPYTVEKLHMFNGADRKLTSTRAFDVLMRTTAFTMVDGVGAVLQSEDFTFDGLNRRDEVHLTDETYWKYTYDNKGNLQSAVKKESDGSALADYNFQYTYDDIGNRLTAQEGAKSTSYAPNSLNQYTTIDGAGIAYDVNGNILDDGTWYYIWDAENRLAAQYDHAESMLLEYIYDHRNFRVAKKVWQIGAGWESPWDLGSAAGSSANAPTSGNNDNVGPQIQYLTTDNCTLDANIGFIYEGSLVAAEVDLMDNGAMIRNYTWGLDFAGTRQQVGGIGALLAQEDMDGDTYYYIYNAGGNVTKLINSTDSSIVNTYEYGPFGQVIAKSETVENPYQFNTKYTDEETGLVYYGFRYYNPEHGRWLNQDPIGVNGGINTYNSVSNQMVNGFSGWFGVNFGNSFNLERPITSPLVDSEGGFWPIALIAAAVLLSSTEFAVAPENEYDANNREFAANQGVANALTGELIGLGAGLGLSATARVTGFVCKSILIKKSTQEALDKTDFIFNSRLKNNLSKNSSVAYAEVKVKGLKEKLVSISGEKINSILSGPVGNKFQKETGIKPIGGNLPSSPIRPTDAEAKIINYLRSVLDKSDKGSITIWVRPRGKAKDVCPHCTEALIKFNKEYKVKLKVKYGVGNK